MLSAQQQWMEDFAIVWLSDLFYMLVHKKVAFSLLLRTLSLWVCLSQAAGNLAQGPTVAGRSSHAGCDPQERIRSADFEAPRVLIS